MISGRSGGSTPATEWIRITSSASRGSSGGRIEGSRRPSIVFPVPGGPASSRLWPPAAASSSARRARSCPRTSARSGGSGSPTSSGGSAGGGRSSPRRYATASAQVPDGNRLDPTELRLARRLGRAEDPLETRPARTLGDGECAADRPHAAVERELADGRMLGEPLGRQLPRGRQHRERDREVEAGALLAQAGGREVDRDPLQRPLELGRADAAADAVLRLGAGPVGEPDDREAGQAAVDVRLHLDAPRLEADEGVGDGAREHSSARYGRDPSRVCHGTLTIQRQIRIDSKYSPARRPVRRLTCRSSRSSSRRPARSRISG